MIEDALAQLKQSGVVAIIRGRYSVAQLLSIGATLVDAGITTLEVTLNTTDALAAIQELREQLATSALVGAGTVRTAAQLRAAVAAGAQFSVAPHFDADTLAAAQRLDCLHLPGVFTPTEAEAAHRAGAQVLKLFPADALGPSYLRALRAPLDDLSFVPTGGISAENAGVYRAAGATAVGVGSALVRDGDEPRDALRRRAVALRDAWLSGG